MKSKVFNKGNDRILALEDHCNDDEEDDVVMLHFSSPGIKPEI